MTLRSVPLPSLRRLRWKARLKRLAKAPVKYAWDFHLKGHWTGLRFARRVWDAGWALRLVFGALLLLAAGAGLAPYAGDPAVEQAATESIFLVLCALAFGTGAAAAASFGVGGFLLLVPWLAYFCLPALTPLGATALRPLMALPIWTLLYIGGRLCLAEPRRLRAAACWTIFALGAGTLTSGVTGFRAALGVSWPVGALLLGSGFLASGFALRYRIPAATPLRFWTVLALAGGVMGVLLLLSGLHDRSETVSWAANFFPQLDFLVTLFWFWSGAGFVLAIWKLVEWLTRRGVRVGLGRALVYAPFLWCAAAIVEWQIARDGAAALAYFPSLDARSTAAPDALEFAAKVHLGLLSLVLAVYLALRLTKRLQVRWLFDLNTLLIVSFLALLAVVGKFTSFEHFEASTSWNGPALAAAIVGGLRIVSRAHGDWGTASDRRVALYAAWGAAMVTILVADMVMPTWKIDQDIAVQVFQGMLTLGLPLAVHARLTRRRPSESRAPALVLLGLFFFGTVLAAAVMNIESMDWRYLCGAFPIAAPVLFLLARAQPRWDGYTFALAGAMIAAGATLYWRLPATFCIPFQTAIPGVETLNRWYAERRNLPVETELWLNFLGVPLGAAFGAVIRKFARRS